MIMIIIIIIIIIIMIIIIIIIMIIIMIINNLVDSHCTTVIAVKEVSDSYKPTEFDFI